jgi:hypothetical protein
MLIEVLVEEATSCFMISLSDHEIQIYHGFHLVVSKCVPVLVRMHKFDYGNLITAYIMRCYVK